MDNNHSNQMTAGLEESMEHICICEEHLWKSTASEVDRPPADCPLLRHGTSIKYIHGYFSNLEKSKCCTRLRGSVANTENTLRPVIERSASRATDVEFVDASRDNQPRRTTQQLTSKELQVYTGAFLCAVRPLLCVPEPPSLASTPAVSPSIHSSDSPLDHLYGYSPMEENNGEEVGLIPSETLIELIHRAFSLGRDTARQLDRRISNECRKLTYEKILAEDLMMQISLIDKDQHPYYNSRTFVKESSYEVWRSYHVRQLMSLLDKFWHEAPPEITFKINTTLWRQKFDDFRLLLVKLVQYEEHCREVGEAEDNRDSRFQFLSSASQRLLREFACRYSILEMHQLTCILEASVARFRSRSLGHVTSLLKRCTELLGRDQLLLVKNEERRLQVLTEVLLRHCSDYFSRLGLIFTQEDNGNRASLEDMLQLLNEVVKLHDVLNISSRIIASEFISKCLQTSFSVCYELYKQQQMERLWTDHTPATSRQTTRLQTSPQVVSALLMSAGDEVRFYRQQLGPTLKRIRVDIAELAARAFYELIMNDVTELLEHHLSQNNPNIVIEYVGLMHRLHGLDLDWRDYIPPSLHRWRERFVVLALRWLRAIERDSLELIKQAIAAESFDPISVSTDSLLECQSRNNLAHSSSTASLSQSVRSAFQSVSSSRATPVGLLSPVSGAEENDRDVSKMNTYHPLGRQSLVQAEVHSSRVDEEDQMEDIVHKGLNPENVTENGYSFKDSTGKESSPVCTDSQSNKSPISFEMRCDSPATDSTLSDGEDVFPEITPVRFSPPFAAMVNKLPSPIQNILDSSPHDTGTFLHKVVEETDASSYKDSDGDVTPTPQSENSDQASPVFSSQISGSVLDLLSIILRMMGFGGQLMTALSPLPHETLAALRDLDRGSFRRESSASSYSNQTSMLGGIHSPRFGLRSTHESRTLIDEELDLLHDRVSARKLLFNAVLNCFCNSIQRYAENVLCVDMCAAPRGRLNDFFGSDVVENVRRLRREEKLFGCRHMKTPGGSCVLYVQRQSTARLMKDKFEQVTEKMCTRVNDVEKVSRVLAQLTSRLTNISELGSWSNALSFFDLDDGELDASRARTEAAGQTPVEHVPSSAANVSPTTAGRVTTSAVSQISFNSDSRSWVERRTFERIQQLTHLLSRYTEGLLQLIAYRINLFVAETLHMYLGITSDFNFRLPVSTRLQHVLQFLSTYLRILPTWLTDTAFQSTRLYLWQFIVQDFEELLEGLVFCRQETTEAAKSMLLAMQMLIQLFCDRGKGLSLEQAIKPAKSVIFHLEVNTYTTQRLIALYTTIRQQEANSVSIDWNRRPSSLNRSISQMSEPPNTYMQQMQSDLHALNKCFSGKDMLEWVTSHADWKHTEGLASGMANGTPVSMQSTASDAPQYPPEGEALRLCQQLLDSAVIVPVLKDDIDSSDFESSENVFGPVTFVGRPNSVFQTNAHTDDSLDPDSGFVHTGESSHDHADPTTDHSEEHATQPNVDLSLGRSPENPTNLSEDKVDWPDNQTKSKTVACDGALDVPSMLMGRCKSGASTPMHHPFRTGHWTPVSSIGSTPLPRSAFTTPSHLTDRPTPMSDFSDVSNSAFKPTAFYRFAQLIPEVLPAPNASESMRSYINDYFYEETVPLPAEDRRCSQATTDERLLDRCFILNVLFARRVTDPAAQAFIQGLPDSDVALLPRLSLSSKIYNSVVSCFKTSRND